jgi:hypothetical protein
MSVQAKRGRSEKSNKDESAVLASVLPCVLGFLDPQQRLVLRSCHKSFRSKRTHVQVLDFDLLRDSNVLQPLDFTGLFSVVPASVTELVVQDYFVVPGQLANLKAVHIRLTANRSLTALCELLGHAPDSLDLHVCITCSPALLDAWRELDLVRLRSLKLDFKTYEPYDLFLEKLNLPHLEWLSLPHARPSWNFLVRLPALRALRCDCEYADTVVRVPLPVQQRLTRLIVDAHQVRAGVSFLSGFSSLVDLELDFRTARVCIDATLALVGVLRQLQRLKTVNVVFPTSVIEAPSLLSFEAVFHKVPSPGLCPICPRLTSLLLDVHWFRSGRVEHSVESMKRLPFGLELVRGGLRDWLRSLTGLETLELRGDGTKEVSVEDLPPSVRTLRLSGLRRVRALSGDVWPVLKTWPRLGHLFVSTRELGVGLKDGLDFLEHDRQQARDALRNTVVVLRAPECTTTLTR